MERQKRDLEALVSSQKEQLSRYEKRLKDVVTAYKGLLKEKEALETSLAAVTAAKDLQTEPCDGFIMEAVPESPPIAGDATKNGGTNTSESKTELQSQIITLMNSLATLSAEKSRMEASFQADKKQLRLLLDQRDKKISDLNIKVKEHDERAKADVDEMKAKWIVERQEREKETNNQMLMIRELQKLYADERHLKENIEMQLNNFKTQFASNEAENSRVRDLQAQLKDSKAQLKQLQANSKHNFDADITESAVILKQVRQEMQQLKEQHAIAIKSEQKRALLAEEQSKKQAALHEDRVANLEARLAELSTSVGTYDRLRQQDQNNIQVLKQKLQDLERSADSYVAIGRDVYSELLPVEKRRVQDIPGIVDEIVRLKMLLISENAHAANPIDLSSIFAVGADHVQCQEDMKHMQQQLDAEKRENASLQEKVVVQKSHIHTLQEKVKVLNRNIDEHELELKQQSEKLRQSIREERSKWKDTIAELENEYRCKMNNLEQQLQKQRQRSLQLLDEKEQEIKTLQTSFEIFHNAAMPAVAIGTEIGENHETNIGSSDGESNDGAVAPTTGAHGRHTLKSKKMSVGDNCHMLHYANEIARKDIEIVGLRKSKYAAETALRKAIQEKVAAQEDLCDKISLLEEQVDRLERCKTREGANLEYLKNVIISFIVTKDADGKRHMMNAISAVLELTPIEIQTINAAFQKK